METIQYVDVVESAEEMPKGARVTAWGTFFPGQGRDGYGRKMASSRKVRIEGQGQRWYRVYVTCFSNCASQWIMAGGKKRFLRD